MLNALEMVKRKKTERQEISIVNRTFIQFFLDIFNSSITIAASTKSINTNNRSSLTLHPSSKNISNARSTTVTINQNTQLFNQDFILSMFYKLRNKNHFYILNSDNTKTFNTKMDKNKYLNIPF